MRRDRHRDEHAGGGRRPGPQGGRRRVSRLTIWAVERHGEIRPGDQPRRARRRAPAASAAERPARRRRRPRRHPEGRVEGRGPARRHRPRRPAVAQGPWSRTRPCGSCAAAATWSSPRPGTASCAPTRGVDLSNVERGEAALLPIDTDRSARRIRDGLRARLGVEVGVIVSRHVRPALARGPDRRRHRRGRASPAWSTCGAPRTRSAARCR